MVICDIEGGNRIAVILMIRIIRTFPKTMKWLLHSKRPSPFRTIANFFSALLFLWLPACRDQPLDLGTPGFNALPSPEIDTRPRKTEFRGPPSENSEKTTTLKSNVSQTSLDNLFNKSKRIIVRKSEINDKILYESNKKPDLALLQEVMRISPDSGEVLPCRHVGAPIIEFYYKKQYVGWVALHDGMKIRTSFWNTDAEIADKERFLKWFDRRKMADPRRRAEVEGAVKKTSR